MILLMSEPTPLSLRRHHGDVRSWTTDWYDEQGHRRMKRFGKETEVGEKQARALFRNWLKNEWEAKAFVRNPEDPTTYSVALLAEAYKEVARKTYRKNGEETTHVGAVIYAMDALTEAYGALPASALDNPKIARLRDAMIFDPEGNARSIKTVNGRLHCIKAAMKWARERELISREALNDVLAVTPLRAGRCDAKPSKKVKPVPEAVVELTLAKLPPTVRTMVEVQQLTGMRPGEVCHMRACDIDQKMHKARRVWVYTPHTHKLEHKEKPRSIAIGQRAQALLRPFLSAVQSPAEYLFSPAKANAERLAEKHRRRLESGTPLSCGNRPGSNKLARPTVKPGTMYDNQSYRKAIRHACRAVEKEMRKTDPKAKFPAWHPNQLRHSFATLVRRDFGKEAVADTLGHSNMDMAEVYAERSLDRAIEVAREVG